MSPHVTAFFDNATNTVSYVVRDPKGTAAAIIDSVLDSTMPRGARTPHRPIKSLPMSRRKIWLFNGFLKPMFTPTI